MWEAQYGDFINGAQIVLDEYLTSGRAKWGMAPSLVLLLPHGYEGQGPDHSSARLERFLNAAADTNMRIVNCTTAAQYFHVLRRQALLLTTDPLPLVVMTPKSLLRHPMTASAPAELAEGRFQMVIDDPVASAGEGAAARAVQRQGRRRSPDERAAQRQRQRGDRAGRAALPVPGRRHPEGHRRLPEAARGLLGARGAGKHGRVGIRAPAARERSSTRGGRCATSAASATPARRRVRRAGTRRTSGRSWRKRSKPRPRRRNWIAFCPSKCRE